MAASEVVQEPWMLKQLPAAHFGVTGGERGLCEAVRWGGGHSFTAQKLVREARMAANEMYTLYT